MEDVRAPNNDIQVLILSLLFVSLSYTSLSPQHHSYAFHCFLAAMMLVQNQSSFGFQTPQKMDNSNVNNLGLQNGLESHRLFDQLVNHRRQPEKLLGLAGEKLVKVLHSIADVRHKRSQVRIHGQMWFSRSWYYPN